MRFVHHIRFRILSQLGIFLLVQAPLALALDLSREAPAWDSIEDRTQSPKLKSSAPKNVESPLSGIVQSWKNLASKLVLVGKDAEGGEEYFLRCEGLKVARPSFVKVKSELEKPEFESSFLRLQFLDTKLRRNSRSDICRGGFSAVQEQLNRHEEILQAAIDDYEKSFANLNEETVALYKLMKDQKIDSGIDPVQRPIGYISCEKNTKDFLTLIQEFIKTGKSVHMTLYRYSEEVKKNRAVLNNLNEKAICDFF